MKNGFFDVFITGKREEICSQLDYLQRQYLDVVTAKGLRSAEKPRVMRLVTFLPQ